MTKSPRIGVAGFNHESNSFASRKTPLGDFIVQGRGWDKARFVSRALEESTEMSGFVAGAQELGLDVVPTIMTVAVPSGPVQKEAFEVLTDEIISGLIGSGPLDGVYLALHGAMVVDGYDSGDAQVVTRVRQAVGPRCPIVVTHDFHSNISADIVAACDALLTYKENPHIDTKDRGLRAAFIMAGIVNGTFRPTQALVKPPMIYNIAFQATKRAPLLPLVDETRRMEQDPRILGASIAGGYQYADVPQMGPSVVVVTNGDQALADSEAKRLGDMLWATRDQTVLRQPDAATAVAQAILSDKKPVVLMDMGDNIGGGSSGDGTFLLHELLRQNAQGWVVALADPAAVSVAARLGVGQPFDRDVGGKADQLQGSPVRLRGHVRSLHEGKFVETEVRHLGVRFHDMGLSAVIENADSTPDHPNLVVLTSKRFSPYSLGQLTSVGVVPPRQNILVVKGTIAPRAAYEPIAGSIVEVNTAGATSADPTHFPYRNVRRPLFGLD